MYVPIYPSIHEGVAFFRKNVLPVRRRVGPSGLQPADGLAGTWTAMGSGMGTSPGRGTRNGGEFVVGESLGAHP